jgi:hypothetical protein
MATLMPIPTAKIPANDKYGPLFLRAVLTARYAAAVARTVTMVGDGTAVHLTTYRHANPSLVMTMVAFAGGPTDRS